MRKIRDDGRNKVYWKKHKVYWEEQKSFGRTGLKYYALMEIFGEKIGLL